MNRENICSDCGKYFEELYNINSEYRLCEECYEFKNFKNCYYCRGRVPASRVDVYIFHTKEKGKLYVCEQCLKKHKLSKPKTRVKRTEKEAELKRLYSFFIYDSLREGGKNAQLSVKDLNKLLHRRLGYEDIDGHVFKTIDHKTITSCLNTLMDPRNPMHFGIFKGKDERECSYLSDNFATRYSLDCSFNPEEEYWKNHGDEDEETEESMNFDDE